MRGGLFDAQPLRDLTRNLQLGIFGVLDRDLPEAVGAEGAWITAADGRRFLDGAGGAIVVNVGHGDREVIDAVGGITIDNPTRVRTNPFECPFKTPEECAERFDGWQFRKGEIHLDGFRALIYARTRVNQLDPGESERRRSAWQPRATDYGSGSHWKYAQTVGPAEKGAVTHPGAKAEGKSYAEL